MTRTDSFTQPGPTEMAQAAGTEEPGAERRASMDTALPDDDGMKGLRAKLHEIRMLAVSAEEKARRMHLLINQDWLAHNTEMETEEPLPPHDPDNPYNIRPADLEPSFSPLPVTQHASTDDQDECMEDELPAVLGCAHYKRNVKVQCFDCKRWYTCRYCHDASPTLPFPHNLRRPKTENMLCMLCKTPQPAAEVCINCGEYAAWYYCPKCKLWDNDANKRIYHCDDCGICRVGEGLGRDFAHCRRCNVCISIQTAASHPCIERATEGDCPLCLIRLFESQKSVVSLPCGHYMHGDCFKELMNSGYKCPVCSKSAVNMELQWRKLDEEIRLQPMPEDDEDLEGLLPLTATTGDAEQTHGDVPQPRRPREVFIGCNDCGRRSWTAFHWLGLKCHVCDSYNTNQMAPTATQETEAERLLRQQQQQHRQHDFTGTAVLRDAGIGAADAAPQVETATLQVPTSPSQAATPDSRRTSGSAHSPRGRYFVQDEERRRPSFTAPRFAAPTLPTLPNLPNFPQLPDMPRLPRMPNMPHMPNMPNIELPRFSPYEMFDAVSRSLSPMRYYLQGLDDVGMRRRSLGVDRNRSPTSIRSAPTPIVGGKRKNPLGSDEDDEEAVQFWGSDEQFLSGEEADEDDDDDGVRVLQQGEETSSEEESSSEEEGSDVDMDDDGIDDDEDESLLLPGHR